MNTIEVFTIIASLITVVAIGVAVLFNYQTYNQMRRIMENQKKHMDDREELLKNKWGMGK